MSAASGVVDGLAIALLASAYMIGVPGDPSPVVRKVEPGKPAATIGMLPGDRVIAVNGTPTPNFDSVARAIQDSKGRAVTVRVVERRAADELLRRVGARVAVAADRAKVAPRGVNGHRLQVTVSAADSPEAADHS